MAVLVVFVCTTDHQLDHEARYYWSPLAMAMLHEYAGALCKVVVMVIY